MKRQSSLTTRAVAGCAVAALLLASAVQAAWQITLFSDAHFDPAYGTSAGFGACKTSSAAKLGQKGCDAPADLMTSTMGDLSLQKSDFTIYGGDWQRHDFEGTTLTAEDVFGPFSQWVAGITASGRIAPPAFVGSWGNNDVVPDYDFDVTSATQPELQTRAMILKKNGVLTAEQEAEFGKCGFYVQRTPQLSVIVLHTLIYSYKITPAVADDNTDPCGQFQFLTDELEYAKTNNLPAIVVGHIPPTLDLYAVTKGGKGQFRNESKDMFWKKSFQERYEGIIQTYKDTVRLHIFGHTHLFNVFAFTNVGVPMLVLPAITPLFGNLPAYLLANFDNNFNLQDMQMRYLDASTWEQGMGVSGALGIEHGFANVDALRTSLSELATNDRLWSNYLVLHSGGKQVDAVYAGGSCDAQCRRLTVCMTTNSSYEDIQGCVAELKARADALPPVDVNLSGSIVTSVLILGVVFTVATILVLVQVVPKIRAGELSFSKMDFDLRAQLLNATPKKEKLRRQQEAAERTAAAAQRYREEQPNSSAFDMDSAQDGAAQHRLREGDAEEEEEVSVAVRETRHAVDDHAYPRE